MLDWFQRRLNRAHPTNLLLLSYVAAIAVGTLNFAAMWTVGRLVFGVPMVGSLPLLASLTVLFVTAVVGWGLFISAVSQTQQQATGAMRVLTYQAADMKGFMPTITIPASEVGALELGLEAGSLELTPIDRALVQPGVDA